MKFDHLVTRYDWFLSNRYTGFFSLLQKLSRNKIRSHPNISRLFHSDQWIVVFTYFKKIKKLNAFIVRKNDYIKIVVATTNSQYGKHSAFFFTFAASSPKNATYWNHVLVIMDQFRIRHVKCTLYFTLWTIF